jgi:hypothetical protein
MRKGFWSALLVALSGTSLALAEPSLLIQLAATSDPTRSEQDDDAPAAPQASLFVRMILTGQSPVCAQGQKDDLGPMPPADDGGVKPQEAIDLPKPPAGSQGQKDDLGPMPPADDGDVKPQEAIDLPKPPAGSLVETFPSSTCNDCCDPCCCCCEKQRRFWGDVESLFFWLKHGPLPVPLVSTGSPASLGILGNGGSVLFGNTGLNYGELNGFRVNAGSWLNECSTVGVEAGFFLLEQGTTGFASASNGAGTPVLTIPIVNAQTGTASGVAVALPGAFAGSVGVSSSSRFFGSNLDAVYNAYRQDGLTFDGLAGFRYLNLEERLGLRRSATTLPGANRFFLGAQAPGTSTANIADEFDTQDQFFGGELGARVDYTWNKLTATALAKAALGGNLDIVNIHGTTTLIQPGLATVTVPGGLLAGASNSGRFHESPLCWSPELRAQLGYQLTDHIRVFAGYTWMYWNEVARPGNQIDNGVNLTQFALSPTFGALAGPQRPLLTNHNSGFWAQGVDAGVGFSY